MRLLIVDDEPVQLQSLKRGLATKGYQVLEALNPEEGLELLAAEPEVDLVLTDYAMPKMNGLQFLTRIRQDFGKVPVVMMTACGGKDLVVEALKQGCNGYIEKPFTLASLNQEIERVLNTSAPCKACKPSVLGIPELIHQFDKPLSGITGSAELGPLETDDAEEIPKRLQGILRAAQAISQLNKRLIDLGKQSSDCHRPINLSALITDSLATFDDLFRLTGVEVELELPDPEMWVNGSKFDLEQLLKNLLLNAVEAMEHRPIKKLVVSGRFEDQGAWISLAVNDTGSGISQRDIGDIFKPYFSKKTQGTGLGLSVVKHIVKEHQGNLKVTSRLNEGTTLVVNLPALLEGGGASRAPLGGESDRAA